MLTSITNLFQEVDQNEYFGMKDHQKITKNTKKDRKSSLKYSKTQKFSWLHKQPRNS